MWLEELQTLTIDIDIVGTKTVQLQYLPQVKIFQGYKMEYMTLSLLMETVARSNPLTIRSPLHHQAIT